MVVQCDLIAIQFGLPAQFGSIVPVTRQTVEVRVVDVSSHVVAVEHRTVKGAEPRIALLGRRDEVLDGLVDQPVGTNDAANLVFRAVVGNEFVSGGMSMP